MSERSPGERSFAMIGVGDELLDGRVRDANAHWLGRELSERGARLVRVWIVPDELDDIVAALEAAASRCEAIVISGGLGPTADDRSREAAARWCGRELRTDEERVERMRERYRSRGYPFTPNNRRQARAPEGATFLDNEVGTAPGFRLEGDDGVRADFFPGVPREFRWCARRYVLDELGVERTARRQLHVYGLGESQLETRLDGIEELAAERSGRVGYRASFPVVTLHLSAGSRPDLDALVDYATERVGAWIVARDDETLSSRLGDLLDERGQEVTFAESCTAGGAASMLTETPGSSAYFARSWVTYSNDAKRELLGVDADVLARHGAVSAACVAQMAAGALDRAGADHALAVSGIAGPGGGSADKPVGRVHFALATSIEDGLHLYHREVTYPMREREQVRTLAIYTALALLLWLLDERLDEHRVDGPFDHEQVWSGGGIEVS